MKKNRLLRSLNLIFGFLSILFFGFDIYVFARLQSKMVNFELLTDFEEPLLTWVGFGLLILLMFFLLSFLQIIKHIRGIEKIAILDIVLLVCVVISFIAVFADVALLSDIHKQYLNFLSQPEWFLVYPIMGFQFLIVLILMYFHLTGRWTSHEIQPIIRDMNVFLIVQLVGVICGAMGLGLMGLGFFFLSGWNFSVHTLISSVIFLFPFALSIVYWVIMKMGEKERQWFDEKQQQDLGKSALISLFVVTLIMLAIYIGGLPELNGLIQFNWLPIYLFSVIFFFSLGNLYYGSRV